LAAKSRPGGGPRARVGGLGAARSPKAKQGGRIDLATLQEDATVGCRVICRIGFNCLVFVAVATGWWLVREWCAFPQLNYE
jgi:hypothetical protein